MGQNRMPETATLLADLIGGYSYYYFLAHKPQKYARLFHEWGLERGEQLSSRYDLAQMDQLRPQTAEISLDNFLDTGNLVRKSVKRSFKFDAGDNLCYYTRGLLEGYLSQTYPTIKSVKEVDCAANSGKYCHFIASETRSSLKPPQVSPSEWSSIKKDLAGEVLKISQREKPTSNFQSSPEAFLHLPELANQISTSALCLLAHDFGCHLGQEIKDPEFKSYLDLSLDTISSLGWERTQGKYLGDQGLLLSFRRRPDLDQKQNESWMSGLCKGLLQEFTNTEWHVSSLKPGREQIRFKCRNL